MMRLVLRLCFVDGVRKQLLPFGSTPQVSKVDLASTSRLFAPQQQRDRGADLDAFAIELG
jgi:hypothetical protein